MLLKPMSQNVFFATLIVTSVVLASLALAQPVFGPMLASDNMQAWLRQVVVPMFQA